MLIPPCPKCYGINEIKCYWCEKTIRHYIKIDRVLVEEMKYLYKLWCQLRDFNMTGTGSVSIDEKLFKFFGDHKKPRKRPDLVIKL